VNTPHETLTRTTFSLPLGKVHALVGGAVNARPLLFLHGFPDHPPTAVPFLEHLAETHRVVAPWLRGYAPSPIVSPYDLDTLAADALAADRRGSSVVRRACPRGRAEPRSLPAHRGSRYDRRARRLLVGVALRMRRYAARREAA
jgi:hypothetical protein